MPKFLAFILFVFIITGCAHHQSPIKNSVWPEVGYQGLREQIDILVGADAHSCGFYQWTKPSSAELDRAAKCIKSVLANGKPWKYGAVSIPLDSYAYEIALKSTAGNFWLINIDVALDHTESHQWAKICKGLKFDERSFTFEGKDCMSVNDNNWELIDSGSFSN